MAKDNQNKNMIGTVLFGLGALIALVGGLKYPGGLNATLSGALIALGTAVGLLNIKRDETQSFMLMMVSLVIISSLGGAVVAKIPTFGLYIEGILLSVLTFVIPAGVIVAFKEIIVLARD